MNNKLEYEEWVNKLGFTQKRFYLTWIDLELLIGEVIKQYNVSSNTYMIDILTDKFMQNYTVQSKYGIRYKLECKELGLKALHMLKRDSDWHKYIHEVAYMDLFNRCILFDFKNSKFVKDFMRSGVVSK